MAFCFLLWLTDLDQRTIKLFSPKDNLLWLSCDRGKQSTENRPLTKDRGQASYFPGWSSLGSVLSLTVCVPVLELRWSCVYLHLQVNHTLTCCSSVLTQEGVCTALLEEFGHEEMTLLHLTVVWDHNSRYIKCKDQPYIWPDGLTCTAANTGYLMMNQTRPQNRCLVWSDSGEQTWCSHLAPRMFSTSDDSFSLIAFDKFNKSCISYIKSYGKINSTWSLSPTTDTEKAIFS